ncbi:MAG: rod shape-determining protein MreC [Bacteroidota bacterium]
MYRLFQFIYKYRAFFLFLFLESVCAYLIIQNNQYQSASFLNSSNFLAASILKNTSRVSDYFTLQEKNRLLSEENALLRERLERLRQSSRFVNKELKIDYSKVDQFEYEPVEVINKSIARFDNYLTINKGYDSGIEPGMGVIGAEGIVGKVKATSRRFSTVVSVLHSEMLTSSLIKKSNTLCTTKWDGRDPTEARLLYVPRHLDINLGDSVVTSGYSIVYPQNILIGTIKEASIDENETFYNIRIDLATDFRDLKHAYVIKNKIVVEKDSLEQKLFND